MYERIVMLKNDPDVVVARLAWGGGCATTGTIELNVFGKFKLELFINESPT